MGKKKRELREGFRLQRIEENDANILYNMIIEHAKLEDEEFGVTATLSDYQSALSSSPPSFYGYFIQKEENNNEYSNIGIMMYYFGFSSWKGKKTLFLEDVFIHNQYRKLGLGRDIMRTLANIAKEEDCPRIDWVVHNLNDNARAFYNRNGAKELNQWILSRIDDSALLSLQCSL